MFIGHWTLSLLYWKHYDTVIPIIYESDPVRQVYGADSYMQYYPLVLYSVAPLIASTLYSFLAKALNDFEEHSTPVRQKNMLVIKVRTEEHARHQGTEGDGLQ